MKSDSPSPSIVYRFAVPVATLAILVIMVAIAMRDGSDTQADAEDGLPDDARLYVLPVYLSDDLALETQPPDVIDSMLDDGPDESKLPRSSPAQETVERTLHWLQSVQRENGSWQDSPRYTGQAILVYLAHGDTPLSDQYGTTVRNAMRWSAHRMVRMTDDDPWTTDDAILLYALAEGYGMTHIPMLKTACESGQARLIAAQRDDGGWGDADAATYDREQTWWSAHALKAISLADIGDPDAIAPVIVRLVDAVKTAQFAEGRYVGDPRHAGQSVEMLQIFFAGDSPEVTAGIRYIASHRTPLLMLCATTGEDLSRHRFMAAGLPALLAETSAMFNAHGKEWRDWTQALVDPIVQSQSDMGDWVVPRDDRTGESLSDRIEATCLMTLPLQTYGIIRYMPDISKMDPSQKAATLDATDSGLIIR